MATVTGSTGAPTNTQDLGDEIYHWLASGSITFSVGGLIEFLIISGGGSGGSGGLAGGGGGAGAHSIGSFTAVAGTYTITVGPGGLSVESGAGLPGSVSGITVGVNAPGDLSGGAGGAADTAGFASVDGSGSGAGAGFLLLGGLSGLFGNDGGVSSGGHDGGGGGGSGAVGGSGLEDTNAGNGGVGTSNSITGSAVSRAAGGGGAPNRFGTSVLGVGGVGGGGDGSNSGVPAVQDGLDGTGSGGGGNSNLSFSGAGGDGVVIIRFTPEAVASDTIPDAFAFTDVTGQVASSAIESDLITITGIDAATAISVDTGEYRINGGAYTAVAGAILVNQTVQLRHTSSALANNLTSQVLTVGTITDQWDVTTAAALVPLITVVDSPVLDAELLNSLTVTGFAADLDTISLTSPGNAAQVLNFTGTGGSYTFDLPDIAGFAVDTLGQPFTSASHAHSILAESGLESDSELIIVNPKAGYAVIEITGAVSDKGYVFENFTGTIPDTSQVLYPTADVTSVDAQGRYLTDNTATDINMHYWDAVIGNWQPFVAETAIPALDATASLVFGALSASLQASFGNTIAGSVSLSFGSLTADIQGSFSSPITSSFSLNLGSLTVVLQASPTPTIAAGLVLGLPSLSASLSVAHYENTAEFGSLVASISITVASAPNIPLNYHKVVGNISFISDTPQGLIRFS